MKDTKNPTAVRSQKELINALLALMKTTPYEEISVKQILLESKLSRKTFYRNFDDKDDLLNAHIDSLLLEYRNDLIVNNNYIFTNIMYVVSDFIIKNKEKLVILWENNLEYMLLKKLNSFILTTHYSLKKNNTSRIDDYIVMLNNGAVWNVMNEWMKSGMQDPIDEILASLSDYLMNIEKYDLSDICRRFE